MRVVVTGATGNVGTSTVAALAADPLVTSVLGLARRRPGWTPPKTTWAQADVAETDLSVHFRGADAVVHLAWLLQPSHRPDVLARTNLEGSARVFEAVAAAGVGALVYASSVGAYSPAPTEATPVAENWPTGGIASSTYSRHKALVERRLDAFEVAHPEVRVVRLRPGLIFKREAGSEVRRLFLGPLVPRRLVRRGRVPVVPDLPRLRFQAVHSQDVGTAYRLAVTRAVSGAFNIAAAPVLDCARLAELFGARPVKLPERVVRGAVAASWHLRLQPADAGWFDLATQAPLLDTTRAAEVLGWQPTRSATEALAEIVAGIHDGSGFPTPPLVGPSRVASCGPAPLRTQ